MIPATAEHPRARQAFRRTLIVTVILLIPFAIHGVWDQLEATLYAREIAAIAARGEPVSLRFQTHRQRTSDEQRAARLYAAAADLAEWKQRDDPQLSGRERDVDQAFESGRARPVLDQLRREYVDGELAFNLLAEASALPFAGFAWSMYPPINSYSLVDLSTLNCLRADTLTAEGDSKGAANALSLSLQLQRTMTEELNRSIAARRFYGSLRLLLAYAPPDAATLLELQQAFAALPDSDDVAQQLENRRAELLGDAFWPYPPSGSASWARRLREPFVTGTAEDVAFVVFRPWLTHVVRQEFAPYADAIRVAREPWPQKLNDAAALARRYGVTIPQNYPSHPLLVRFTNFGYINAVAVGMLSQSYLVNAGLDLTIRRTAIAALAAERYRRDHGGETPSSLDALVPAYLDRVPVDPFSGASLRYHRDPDSYVVYGVDDNRTDDGGALYGFASGNPNRMTPRGSAVPRDIGIRVPLKPRT